MIIYFFTKEEIVCDSLIQAANFNGHECFVSKDFETIYEKILETQLEPDLFKKVTGLNVEDFNMLCSIGVFNASLMNDAIFKFKRYEDASLVYTGIDKHTNQEVGGWDTTIRKEQYEKLYYNQSSSTLSSINGLYPLNNEEEYYDKVAEE